MSKSKWSEPKNIRKQNVDAAAKRASDKKEKHAKKAADKAAREAARKVKLAEKRERERIKSELRAEKAKIAAERQKKRIAVYTKIRAKFKNRKSGFDYKNFGFIPRVELAVKGDRSSVVLRLSATGIKVTDVRFIGGETLFKIRKKDLRKAVAILSEMCYTHRINATLGITKSVAFYAARMGLILGAVLSVVTLHISYGYIWRLQITGNSVLSSAAIEATLKRAGITAGCKKSEFITVKTAETLGAMDGISDASCEIIGTTLHVHVLESTESSAISRYGEYVSDYDATITRIVMRSGTATVKRGDVVKRGDLLATGDRFSTAGELMYSGDCDCEVYGNVAVSFTAQIPVSAVEYRRTGKTAAKTVYTLFGKRIGGNKPPFKTYELSSHTSKYDVLIPLYATTYTYEQTVAVEYERDIDEAAQSFAKSKIDSMKFEGEFDYSYSAEQAVSGLYTVHLFIKGETVISRGRERTFRPEQTEKNPIDQIV